MCDYENEEWRPVVGWEGLYEASSLGRVRSLPRTITNANGVMQKLQGKYLSSNPDKIGYVTVNLSDNGRHEGRKVHRLVAEAFIPNPDGLAEVDHINGIRNDNRVQNLRWCTREENCSNRNFDGSRQKVLERVDNHEVLDLPNEEWRDICNYEGLYQISSCGRVKSTPRRRSRGGIIKQSLSGSGYLQVHLCKNGQPKTFQVHRLVATHFLDNPNNLPEVNHKDECKTNNNVSNLEWASRAYNQNYGTGLERRVRNHDYAKSAIKAAANHDYEAIGRKRRKPVLQFDLDGNLIRCWSGLCEVRDELGYSTGAISNACHRQGYGLFKVGVVYGYKWIYKEDYGCVA